MDIESFHICTFFRKLYRRLRTTEFGNSNIAQPRNRCSRSKLLQDSRSSGTTPEIDARAFVVCCPVCTENLSALMKWENCIQLRLARKAESSLFSDDVLAKQPADDASRVASSRVQQSGWH